MRQFGNLKFLVIFSILFLINDTTGLKCWQCSSDGTNSKVCGGTLDLTQIPKQHQRYIYVECDTKPPQVLDKIQNLIPKCMISLRLVNDVETYTRSCYWEQESVPSNSCTIQNYNPSYVKTLACKTCVEDGCNDKVEYEATERPANLEDNTVDNNKTESSAVPAVLSQTLFAILLMSVVIGY